MFGSSQFDHVEMLIKKQLRQLIRLDKKATFI